MMPPSFDSKNWNGSSGLVTSACWSGCRALGCSWSVASMVMSVAVAPASVESTTARLLERFSPYAYAPPAWRMWGWPAGVWTKLSYVHWPVHRLLVAKPGSATFRLLRFVKTGAPVATSSLRNSREVGVPVAPSCTYMRVLPFGSSVTASSGRMVLTLGSSDGLICSQAPPASVERHTPRAYEPA